LKPRQERHEVRLRGLKGATGRPGGARARFPREQETRLGPVPWQSAKADFVLSMPRFQPTDTNCGRRTNPALPGGGNTAAYGVLLACATGSGVRASLLLAESMKRVATTTTVVAAPAISKRVRNEKVLVPIDLPSC
jgi:hypothetical protein